MSLIRTRKGNDIPFGKELEHEVLALFRHPDLTGDIEVDLGKEILEDLWGKGRDEMLCERAVLSLHCGWEL